MTISTNCTDILSCSIFLPGRRTLTFKSAFPPPPAAFRRVAVTDSFHSDCHDNSCCAGPADGSRGAAGSSGPAGGWNDHLPGREFPGAPVQADNRPPVLNLWTTRLPQAHSPSSEVARWFAAVAQTCRYRNLLQPTKPRSRLRRPSSACLRRVSLSLSLHSPRLASVRPRSALAGKWLQAPKNLNPRHSQAPPGSCFSLRRANPECLRSCAGARHGGGVQGEGGTGRFQGMPRWKGRWLRGQVVDYDFDQRTETLGDRDPMSSVEEGLPHENNCTGRLLFAF